MGMGGMGRWGIESHGWVAKNPNFNPLNMVVVVR